MAAPVEHAPKKGPRATRTARSAPIPNDDALGGERPAHPVIEIVSPFVDSGRFAAKASIGESVEVMADVFAAGHVVVNAALHWRKATAADAPVAEWNEVRMHSQGNDRFAGSFQADHLGRWELEVISWVDVAEGWRRDLVAKYTAGQNIDLDLITGRRHVATLRDRAEAVGNAGDAARLLELEQFLAAGDAVPLDDDAWTAIFWRNGDRDPQPATPFVFRIDIDRDIARFSAWYEFFPRSSVLPAQPPQTLRTAVDRLDHIASMGFDVVYLPPIHPIGDTKRKGPDNSPVAGPTDVGSPWAIGSDAGGHTAVHPALGTVDDVTLLAAECRARGLELALDIAFQCSPDHPWVTEHPEWFAHRPDGSVQYAENPPKRYEDIYPLDFDTADWQALWVGLADVLRFWIARGVTIFRVDNPHTKAFPFWEWALTTLRAESPETVFLAEAFTRPRSMERLAKIGFNQSYTYFTWRQQAWELREYFADLATRTVDYFRPNAWPNTPDILTEQLQSGERSVFATRALLASTLSANWGVYGPAFELLEHEPARPGSEEYLSSEKYQLRAWHLDDARSLAPLLRRLNEIRRAQPALQHLRTLRFHGTDNEWLLCFSKTDPSGRGAPVIVVANLDPANRQMGFVDIDLEPLGIAYGSSYDVTDELTGAAYRWHANRNFVDLDPDDTNAHIFVIDVPAGVAR